MADALEKVKQDLGPDAVILNTRTMKRGGLWGVGARTVVEITAGHAARDLPPAGRRALTDSGARAPQSAGDPAGWRETGPGGRIFPPIQGYACRWPETLPTSAGVPADAPLTDAIAGQQAGGLTRGRLIRPDGVAQGDLSLLASGLRQEMSEIRAMVRQVLDRATPSSGRPGDGAPADSGVPSPPLEAETPAELQAYYTRLLQNAVAEEVAREIIAKAKDRLAQCRERIQAGVGQRLDADRLDERLRQKLGQLVPAVMMETVERMLPAPGPVVLDERSGPKIVALVGPTGVGKTTTLAKLAAHFTLREHRRVGLITTDTYRIAAVDQLKAYARIMSLPVEVVLTPEELRRAIDRLGACDLILIDTSGRSHRDAQRLSDLRAFLEAARSAGAGLRPAAGRSATRGRRGRRRTSTLSKPASPGASLEVHLLLSCTSDPCQSLQVAERFCPLGVDRVVFTKLDEAVGLGVVLNVAARLNLKLSYLTTGQDVPDDIEVGHRRRLAEMILNGDADEPDAAGTGGAGHGIPRGPVVDQLA